MSFSELNSIESTESIEFVRRLILPPATKLRQGNVFTPVCHSVHRGSAIPPWADTPGQTPPRQTPPRQTPPGQTPPGQILPLGRHPPRAVHACTRYASYWNAILFVIFIFKTTKNSFLQIL